MADDTTNLSVTTDASDYEPGVTAQFTVDGLSAGDAVTFTVAHVDAGADGILGTADDVVLDDITGTGTPWTVTDGGAGDLDGVVNGVVTTSWYVNQDALGQGFVLTATDLNTGASATTSFTDSNPHQPVDANPAVLNDGLVFLTGAQNTSTGTGIFPSFVQIQNTGTEEGFNTDYRPAVEDTGSSPVHNHSITFSTVPTVTGDGTHGTVDGEIYREFRLDLNETNPVINLDQLIIYKGTTGNASTVAGLTELFNMDSGPDGDVSIALTAWSSGSGHSDYKILIPDSYFAGTSDNDFIYLFSQFSNSESGFEEWSVGPTTPVNPDTPAIAIEKVTNDASVSGDGLTILSGENISWTYTVTNPDTAAITITSITDDNGTPGNTLDDFHPTYVSGDTNSDGKVESNETWIYTASGVAQTGNYANNVVINGHTDTNVLVTAQDDSSYFGLDPHLTLDKKTNGLDHGLGLMKGQTVTWTYDVTNDGNVDILLSHTGVTDNNGTPGNTADDFHPTYVSGDVGDDGVLGVGETWHFTASGTAVAGSYTNTATATGNTFTDDAGHTRTPSGSDSSDYIGFVNTALTQGFWGSHTDAWDGKLGGEGNSTKAAAKPGGVLSALDINPNHSGNLVLGDTNHNGAADDAHNLTITDTLAALILSASTTGDARAIMLQQAIALQLNIDNGSIQPNNLIDEAVQWLTNQGPWSAGGGFAPGGTLTGTKLSGAAISTSSAAWQAFVDVVQNGAITEWDKDGNAINGNQEANGEGLKNAMMWFNQGQLVTAPGSPGSVGWFDGTSVTSINPNDLDQFWATLHDHNLTFHDLTGIA